MIIEKPVYHRAWWLDRERRTLTGELAAHMPYQLLEFRNLQL